MALVAAEDSLAQLARCYYDPGIDGTGSDESMDGVSVDSEAHTDSALCPAVGRVFASSQAAYIFYNMYSWNKGFGIRYGRSRTNSKGYRTRQDIICSCAGFGGKDKCSTQRSGCPAMIRLLRNDNHECFISRFVEQHNHAMSDSCGETRQWKSHNHIDPAAKEFIRNVKANNVSLGRLYGLLDSTFGRVMTDHENRISGMLWCSGKNKMEYAVFGDVVTFDTTYMTNLYNMPFGLFVGVNSHFQSTVFGAVLLTTETIQSFTLAFQTFISFMGGKEPQAILTDQCPSMAGAIRDVLPNSRHRWCRWHVLKNAKENLGSVYNQFSGFKGEFHSLIMDVMDEVTFEQGWVSLVAKYGLSGNDYLSRMFGNREMWAKPYFRGAFCAGMTSTQRSESANHLLKSFIPRSSPMHLFVSQYHAMLLSREADEQREEHVRKQGWASVMLIFNILDVAAYDHSSCSAKLFWQKKCVIMVPGAGWKKHVWH
ncbi:hypothetical protein C2845_PM15G00640 [Panicum miliaceum]|uniref:Protein FAR1-RELATED SEQUENCE n=1 Tax=Panicum miliaceum TaxID=4540 RepID=A0A3L6Q881_PANMI|nr:hypothetical protein C2845_PM15G00640 [Panicum miliaceum]